MYKFMWDRYRTLKRLSEDRKGTAAIEFALLAIPFFALLFAIVEVSIVFFVSSSLSHATSEASRLIRIGSFQQSCGNADSFKQQVCANMAGFGNCQQYLKIDVVTSDTGRFQTSLLPPTPDDENDPAVPPSTYVDTPGRAVVIVRSQYFHPLSMPHQLTYLSNRADKKTRLITATTAFRNEPFPNGCSGSPQAAAS